MPSQQAHPIVFDDFRPGIADNLAVNYPPTQATRTNTYRCIANRNGALVPLPRRDYSLAGTHFEASNPTSGYYQIVGFFVGSPVLPVSGTASARPHEFFIGTEYVFGGNRVHKLQRYRLFESAPTTDLLKNMSAATSAGGTSGWGMTFGITRSNKADPTGSVGIPVIIASWSNSDNAATGYAAEIPDDATPTLNTPYDAYTGWNLAACHQGRLLLRIPTSYSHAVNGSWNTSEDLRWFPVNDVTAANIGDITSFVPENPDGYGVCMPMSANELFLLKESFGVVITGDLDNPTVINLPMVVGTTVGQQPAVSSLGVIYAHPEAGAWVWAHGDKSDLISPQLFGDFWKVSSSNNLVAQQYQFCRWFDWMLLPNNWLFDPIINSWWRIEDSSLYAIRNWASTRQWLYGSVSTYTHEADTIIYGWDKTTKAISYSWQSQPLWESIDKEVTIKEIDMVVQGQGTVVVTLTTLAGATVSTTVTLANPGYPERFRKQIGIKGRYIQMRLVADGGGSNNAPTIDRVELITDPTHRIPVQA
jgi:hypothetical protein